MGQWIRRAQGRGGPELGGCGSQILSWVWIPGVFEKVKGRLYLRRKKKIRLQKALVLGGQSWPFVVKRSRFKPQLCSSPAG